MNQEQAANQLVQAQMRVTQGNNQIQAIQTQLAQAAANVEKAKHAYLEAVGGADCSIIYGGHVIRVAGKAVSIAPPAPKVEKI